MTAHRCPSQPEQQQQRPREAPPRVLEHRVCQKRVSIASVTIDLGRRRDSGLFATAVVALRLMRHGSGRS